MGAQLGLPGALRARGLTVEVVPGWETRSAGSFNPKGAVCHWTAGPRGSTGRPSLNVVVNGRPGLSGPLCNVYGARDGTAVVVAAGRANHAGTGGWRGLVGNSAVFGTEMEAAGPDDFTAAQRWAYPRINAAFCDLGGFDESMVCGHSEWATPAGRKSDINGYTMADMRAQVRALLNGEDDDMTPEQANQLSQIHTILADAFWADRTRPPFGERGAVANQLTRIELMLRGSNTGGRNNFHWLAEQVVAAVGSIPESQVGVVEEAIADAVADEIDRRERERLGDSSA